ncbi:N-acetylornithine carbamoyltransferase [Rhodocaloribacter litoris]|uniref:N-acetylornithine carbamoyltransferase n=1 Tax=Rhodocaloribacter litoris TaxID=2558931 RepID=UPI00141DF0C5|nr:N-acetylornithine carbamoyltransferase [Rhodocaloribacter litoris]QXD14381.1 N-acetylornithine carbamoyltransferase [Rhodocaloribacter litoris]
MPHLLDWHLLDDATWRRCLTAAVAHYRAGKTWTEAARGKSIALIFFNPSLRTRTSMELAAVQLGAHATTITPGSGTWGFAWGEGVMDGDEAEHIREAVGVLSRYYDALGVRLFASGTDYEQDRTDALLHTFARHAGVPVVNLESAFYHPCQALADAATLATRFDGDVRGRRFVLTWAYHPKALPMAVPNSALLAAARLGMHVTVARPAGFELDEGVMETARAYAAAHGTAVEETDDPDAAYDGAEVIYAKAWGGRLRYTDPDAEAALRASHRGWRVTAERMARTRDGVFMHCLPVRRGVVVDDAVLDGPQAIHLLQAEFRLHAQKAILEHLWGLPHPRLEVFGPAFVLD